MKYPIGMIVRVLHYDGEPLGVLVPPAWANGWTGGHGFARILEPKFIAPGVECNGGWWVSERTITPVVEADVPDEINALAMRCLLDPKFVPFVSDNL